MAPTLRTPTSCAGRSSNFLSSMCLSRGASSGYPYVGVDKRVQTSGVRSQPVRDERDQSKHCRVRWSVPGGGQGVNAVAGELVCSKVSPDVTCFRRLGEEVPDHLVEPAMGFGYVLLTM